MIQESYEGKSDLLERQLGEVHWLDFFIFYILNALAFEALILERVLLLQLANS